MDSDTMMIKQHNVLGPSFFAGTEPAFASSQEKLKQLGISRITTTCLKNQSLCSDTLWPAEVPPSGFPSSGCNLIPFFHLMTGFPCLYLHPVIGRVPCQGCPRDCRLSGLRTLKAVGISWARRSADRWPVWAMQVCLKMGDIPKWTYWYDRDNEWLTRRFKFRVPYFQTKPSIEVWHGFVQMEDISTCLGCKVMIRNGIFGGTLFSDKSHRLVQRNVSRFQFPNQRIEHQSMMYNMCMFCIRCGMLIGSTAPGELFSNMIWILSNLVKVQKSHRLANSGNS